MNRSVFIIIVLSIIPFLSIFSTPQLLHTSDGGVQIPRMAAFYTAVKDGHIPVRWAGNLNYGYGLPLFNFIYHTPFFISTIFISLGFGLIDTFKIVLFLSYLGSGIFMYLFAKQMYIHEKTAIIVTLLYQFAPYRFVELFVRGSVGGIYAYTFLPLTLFFIVRYWHTKSIKYLCGIAISGALMIISHNALALLFFGCIALFVLLFSPSKKSILYTTAGIIGSLALSIYYWLPALADHKYTYGDLFMKDLYKSHFPPFQNFFIPNLFNSEFLRTAEINVHIGIMQTIILCLGLMFLIQIFKKLFHKKTVKKTQLFNNKPTKTALFSLVIMLISFFFMHKISLPFWENISFLRQFQFPWRFLAVISFATALLGSSVLKTDVMKNKKFILLLLISIIPTIFYWRAVQGFTYGATNEKFWNYPLNTTYFGETDVIWSAGPASSYPKTQIEIISGTGSISNIKKITHKQTFIIKADNSVRLVSHTQYFPGWRVFIDTKETPIQFQDPNWRGLITFDVPEGTHTIRIQFGETKIRFIANMISAVTASIIVICLFFSYIKTSLSNPKRQLYKKTN